MLKKAVKLLRGSVCVRAKSAYPERMLNLCSARGIEFWDVRWIDDTALSFCVARGDLRALRRAAEGCGAEVSIERTAGTPFFFARLRRRHALFAGGILCAALLLVNSLFIWDFEVTGNETVPTETILHALREHGVHRGTFIYSFRSQDICNRVLPELKDLCWVAVKAGKRERADERHRGKAGPYHQGPRAGWGEKSPARHERTAGPAFDRGRGGHGRHRKAERDDALFSGQGRSLGTDMVRPHRPRAAHV